MRTRRHFYPRLLLVAVLLCSCEDSGNCPCSSQRIDPPLSLLSVTWDGGTIGANLMPIQPPDPVTCQAWLVLRNMSPIDAFSKLEIPTADVVLARNDSMLGTIPMETDWDGLLAPGERDTIFLIKNTGNEPIFGAPCGDRVFVDFKIRNADGETKVFRSDTLAFQCVF